MKTRRFLRMLCLIIALIFCFGALPAVHLASNADTVEMNVARGKPGKTAANANVPGLTDGNISAIAVDIEWNADVKRSRCWVEIDLEEEYDLSAVKLVQYYSDSRYYHWEAYATNDNSQRIASWTKIAEKSDNSLSTPSGYTARVTESISARYVRIYGTFGSANVGFHFNEVEIYSAVPFEKQTWMSGEVSVTLDELGLVTISGSGSTADYEKTTDRPWNTYAAMIKKVTAENGVTGIGKNNFSGCANLDEVLLPEGLTSIGDGAFSGCESIETLHLPRTLTALGANAFSGTVVRNVDCPKTQGDLYAQLLSLGTGNGSFWCAVFSADATGITNGIVDGGVKWSFLNGTLTIFGEGVSPEMTAETRPWRSFLSQITKVVIAEGVTELGKNSFSNLGGLEEVYFADGFTTIKTDAFAYCGTIDYVRIPTSLTEFGQGIFYSTTVGAVECELSYAEWRANVTSMGPYNEGFASVKWVKPGEYVVLHNLARGIEPEVSAGGSAYLITDGRKSGSFWDGGVGPAEVLIDLGTGAFISSFNCVTYYGDGRYYHYEIYVSTDGRNYTLVAEKNNNVAASASGEDYEFAEPIYGRYVRVVLTYNSANASVHLYEFSVYGEPDPDYVEPEPLNHDEDDPDNVAFGKPVRSGLAPEKAKKVTDGSAATYWTGIYYPAYVDIDLMEEYELSEIIVFTPVRDNRYYYYTVYGSNDLSTFTRLYQKRTTDPATNEGDRIVLNGENYRFIRVNIEYVSGGSASYLAEVRVHGTPTGQNTGAVRTGSIDEILGITDFDETEYATPITEKETFESVYGIIDRTVGAQYRSWFTFELKENTASGNDYYTIENKNGKIHITAGDGVCLAAGLNYYYKYYCGVEISEQARQTKMPGTIVPVEGVIHRETPYKVRYAFNYCTLDYSFAFFGEEDFVKENDWLALCGVNVVLDLAGQEAVWIKFLQNFGYSFDEAKDWIAAPAYYAWQFMDNLESFGGPVPDGWIVDRLNMARKTQRFKRSLGIQTVLQGYAGMVPTNFGSYQDVDILKQGMWCGLARPDMIRTDGELYDEYAALFYDAQRWALGETSNYYAVDPFHEGGIRPADLSDETIAREVLESLLSYDGDAVWMVQAWWSNPSNGLLRGMGDNRQGHVIVLDLTADKWNASAYGGTVLEEKEFNGTDWVWCLLKNYGGNPSMDGDLASLVDDITGAYKNSEHMKGIGLISEATLDNPVIYQLLFDMAWYTEKIELGNWIDDYIIRRYGAYSRSAREAWQILQREVYSRQGNSGQIAARIPDNVGRSGVSQNELQLEKALRLLLEDFDILSESEAYRYDLSELMRQIASNYINCAFNDVYDAYSAHDLDAFLAQREKILNGFDVLNLVLGTEKDLLAGTWIGRAEDWAANYDDYAADTLPLSAKALITTWASAATSASIPDYGYRHYEGMMTDVYKARWETYLDKLEANLRTGEAVVKLSVADYFHVYWAWIMDTPEYQREAQNSPEHILAVAERLLSECSLLGGNDANEGNIAFEKRVKATAEENTPGSGGGYASNAVDGSTDTYWDGGSVTNKPELVVDLGGDYALTKINVVNYFDGGRYYKYDVYVSSDGVNYELAAKKDSNTVATKAGDNFEVSLTARYIKIVGLSNSANNAFHVSEVRAYGTLVGRLEGDLNGDERLDSADLEVLRSILQGDAGETSEADLDSDGFVTIKDAAVLLNIIG